ncbi:MAG: carboxymuconolactone decarboxylase family protein [Bryobacteraceae bacterium]
MTLENVLERIPEYAKDLKLNLSSVLRQAELTPQQTWGTAAACAIAARNPQLTDVLVREAATHLTAEALHAAKAAAAIMGMNNIFYRFKHLVGNPKYETVPARLRMQIIRTHGSDPIDFELWCTAVSSIHGCGACVASHEAVLRQKGMSEETIAAAIRIASVIHAVAVVLEGEAAMAAAG